MKVVYKKPIWEKLNCAIREAIVFDLKIDYIEVTKVEMLELHWYCGAVGCKSFTCDSYGGVTLRVVE